MDTRWLEDILALLEEGTLNRAAARRHVTQPAFSRRIRTFEDWIGVSLLDREVNRIALHPALKESESEIRSLLHRLAELRETLASHERNTQKITVVTQHALSAGAFPEICQAYLERKADLTFRLRTLNRKECISVFLRDEADVLLCYQTPDFPPTPFGNEIVRKPWRKDHLVPVASRALLNGLDRDFVATQLPIIAYPGESHFGRLIADSSEQNNRPLPRGPKRVTSAFSLGVLQLVRAGMGMGWVPASLAQDSLSSGEFISLEEDFGSIGIDITLYAMRSNRHGAGLLTLSDWLCRG